MKIQKTFCRICEAQCGLIANTDNEKIISIEPNPDHVASKGYACMKGLKMGDFAHGPDRLTSPLKKIDGEFQAISWSQALSEIGKKLYDNQQAGSRLFSHWCGSHGNGLCR